MRLARYLVALAALGVGALSAPAGADTVLVQYTFPTVTTSAETGPAYNPTTQAAHITGSAAGDTSGQITALIENPNTSGATYASQPVLRVDPDGHATSAAAAVTNGAYWSFTLTPEAGYELDLTSLTFNTARGGGGTPRGYAVRSSADNFASNLAAADIGTVRPNWTPVSVNLSGATFQDLTSALTFRVYVYAPGDGSTIEFDDVTVSGTVAPVPEPASLALLGLGGLFLLRRRGR